jgi:hypothetical protein
MLVRLGCREWNKTKYDMKKEIIRSAVNCLKDSRWKLE